MGQDYINQHPNVICYTVSSPSPNAYSLNSQFQSKSKGHIYSFGIAREAYQHVFLKQNPPRDPCIPGPGTYKISNDLGKDSVKFTMRPKTTALSTKFNIDAVISKIPGPGTYNALPTISEKGPQFNSKWKSSTASVFHPPQSARFKYEATEKEHPGPGQYDPKQNLSALGNYYISKFKSSMVRSFGNEERGSLARLQILSRMINRNSWAW